MKCVCGSVGVGSQHVCTRIKPVSVRTWNNSAICSSWITCSEKHTQTWSTSDKHLNESTNLLSVWSWLNILSDLYDYGNHTFYFSRGREAVKPNWLSRLRRFDISWNTSKDDFYLFIFLIMTEHTHVTMVKICARVGKYNWLLVRTDGRTKLESHWNMKCIISDTG